MKYIYKISPILIVIFSVVFAIFPLLNPGFFVMHDDEQIGRLFDLHASLMAFHIPPRIVPNLGFGYGYPFFNFYPPFAYYISESFHLLGFGYILSTKLMLISVFMASAFFMYLFSKQYFGRLGGIVSSVAYTYASYRAVDVYSRGAFAEFASFPFIPLLFWSLYKLQTKNKLTYVLISALSFSALILSHNLIAIMTLPFLMLWSCYLIYISSSRRLLVKQLLASVLLGFGLSAYFWLPSYLERDYTLVNILTSELANYSLHFVCAYQLWDSPWGYGGSIQGCFDGISFEIGKIQLLASFLSVVLAGAWIIRGKKDKKIYPIVIFFIFLILNIFLMVKFSKPIWDFIKPLWYIQFPWRFLLITSFVSAFLTGAVVSFISNKYIKITISTLIIILIVYFSIDKFTPQRFINVNDDYYTNIEKIRWDTSSLAYEYVPKGIKTRKSEIGTTKIDITKSEIAKSSSNVVSGKMQVIEVSNKSHYKKFIVKVDKSGIFQVNTYSFPGWEIYIDGKQDSYSDNNRLKLIQIKLPVGEHGIEVIFKNTPSRLVGNIVTGISIIVVGIISFLVFVKRIKKLNK